MFCSRCGKEVKGMYFCAACGHPVHEFSKEQENPSEVQGITQEIREDIKLYAHHETENFQYLKPCASVPVPAFPAFSWPFLPLPLRCIRSWTGTLCFA